MLNAAGKIGITKVPPFQRRVSPVVSCLAQESANHKVIDSHLKKSGQLDIRSSTLFCGLCTLLLSM